MNRRRFVILDRDGTIIVERHYLSDPQQVELLPNAANGLRHMREMKLGLVVITNQSAIGRGFFDEARLNRIHERLDGLLEIEGISLDALYFCPHTPEDDCACRKPRPGLIEVAAADLNFDPRDCFVIGDKPCDIELGQRVGATTFLVRTGYGAQVVSDPMITPDYVVDDLWAAAQIIQQVLETQG
jgi:D-glycero-D-manno-heptose 1,7-bisphosphate phosphatase